MINIIAKKTSIVVSYDNFYVSLADDKTYTHANNLLNKMYGWRGYGDTHQIPQTPQHITLTAFNEKAVIGTITLCMDSKQGMLADNLFKNDLDHFRAEGKRICEITKLAFDKDTSSKQILASLFHLMFIYGVYINKCTDAFIEVNPRHRRFYESMLGFKKIGDLKTSQRVNAPAHLLHLNLLHVEKQIHKMGRTADEVARSLYPQFFSLKDEATIYGEIAKLKQ